MSITFLTTKQFLTLVYLITYILFNLGTRRQVMKDKANALTEKKDKYLEEHMNVTISKGTVYIY